LTNFDFACFRKKSSKNPIPLPARNGVSKSPYHAFPPIKRIEQVNSERILEEWEGMSRVKKGKLLRR
jgi:hypothetical protein